MKTRTRTVCDEGSRVGDARTDVKKGGAEWMDGKRKPRFVRRSVQEVTYHRCKREMDRPLGVLCVEKFMHAACWRSYGRRGAKMERTGDPTRGETRRDDSLH